MPVDYDSMPIEDLEALKAGKYDDVSMNTLLTLKGAAAANTPPVEVNAPALTDEENRQHAADNEAWAKDHAAENEAMRRDLVRIDGSMGTRIKERVKSIVTPSEIPRLAAEIVTVPLNAGLRGLKSVASTVQGGGEAIRKGSIDAGLQRFAKEQAEFEPLTSPLSPSGAGTMISEGLNSGISGLSRFTGRPDIVEPVAQGAMDIAALFGAKAAVPRLGRFATGAAESFRNVAPAALDATISKQYQKAVRPSVSGTAGNYKQFTTANKKAAEGVYDIVKAKDRGELLLGDEMAGQATANRLPVSMQEHLQAISQAKSNTFTKYDALKTEAGDAGAKIDLKPIASELFKASGDTVLNDLRPSTAKYMRDQAEMLTKRDNYTAGQAQQAIATLNKDVESFYRNPSPDMAGKIVVDASIVKHMRAALDAAIEREAGPGYQALKNEYGRLTSMEKEAGHRARVSGRAAPNSLIDAIGGYMGSGEIVSGVLSMNPALIAKGGTMLALKSYIKKMNSPDHQIKKMYRLADKKYVRPPETPYAPIEKIQPEPLVYPGAGKINTLNLPVGDGGAAMNSVTRRPLNLPVGDASTPAPPTVLQTWKEFTTGKMGPYMKEEGGHGPAMTRLSREFAEHKAGIPPSSRVGVPQDLRDPLGIRFL